MLYLYLFITFFEIGLFGFGGGYGMLSLIQSEVVSLALDKHCRVYRHRGHKPNDSWPSRHQQCHILRIYGSRQFWL